jgi:hypothetical protein
MIYIIMTILLFIVSSANALNPIKVSTGRNVLPNGIFAENEWDDATKINAENHLRLFAKQDDRFLYFAIEFLDIIHTGVDLYLAASPESRKMLHVSSALGEKDYFAGSWSDYQWGENRMWTANSIGMVWDGEKSVTVPLEGFEFQISKSMFPATKWNFLIHLKRPEFFYPSDADEIDLDRWQVIEF